MFRPSKSTLNPFHCRPLSRLIDSLVPALVFLRCVYFVTVSRAVIARILTVQILRELSTHSIRYGEFDSNLLSKTKGNCNTFVSNFMPIRTPCCKDLHRYILTNAKLISVNNFVKNDFDSN